MELSRDLLIYTEIPQTEEEKKRAEFEEIQLHLATLALHREHNKREGTHIHLTDKPIDPEEPLGAILWHRRIDMECPLYIAAHVLKTDMMDLFRIEIGWKKIEEPDKDFIGMLRYLYGFTLEETCLIRQKIRKEQKEAPVDLAPWLGIEVPPCIESERPKRIYGENLSCVRNRIRLITRKTPGGIELPDRIVWKDGRVFAIDKIEKAESAARFVTGGAGIRFTCIIHGEKRIIGSEIPGEWFIETPCRKT